MFKRIYGPYQCMSYRQGWPSTARRPLSVFALQAGVTFNSQWFIKSQQFSIYSATFCRWAFDEHSFLILIFLVARIFSDTTQ